MARFCPLFSGSDGNSTYIASKNGALLIDAGASFKALNLAVQSAGGSIDEIRAVAITHEHNDHIKGLKVLLNKIKVPLIASSKTLETLLAHDLIPQGTELICADEGNVSISGMELARFATSHDCEGSSGYTVTMPDGSKVGVCTDLGIVTDGVRQNLIGCSTLLIESNHDVEMLRKGPYPPALKMRILSNRGHLSNNACAAELPKLLENGAVRIILGHLSRNNNIPMIALSAARGTLADIGAKDGRDYILLAAKPTDNGVIPF